MTDEPKLVIHPPGVIGPIAFEAPRTVTTSWTDNGILYSHTEQVDKETLVPPVVITAR